MNFIVKPNSKQEKNTNKSLWENISQLQLEEDETNQ